MGKAIIKKEGKKTPVCVNGLEGKKLTNAVQYRLGVSPGWLKDFYNGKVKYNRSMSQEEHQEFLTNLLNDKHFDGDYWKAI